MVNKSINIANFVHLTHKVEKRNCHFCVVLLLFYDEVSDSSSTCKKSWHQQREKTLMGNVTVMSL